MEFIPPPLKQLRTLASELQDEYKNSNAQQHAFIALLNEVNTNLQCYNFKKIIPVLIGAAVFELEKINSTYFLLAEHRSMIALLNKKLGISKENPLKDDERLYYLNEFFHYVNKVLGDKSIKDINEKQLSKKMAIEWKDKSALKNDISLMIRQVKKRHTEQIYRVVHATPELEALRIGIEKLPEEYEAARAKRYAIMQNARREPMKRMIKFIHESFYHFYPQTENDNMLRLQNSERDARRGLILCVLLDIKSFFPEGSIFNYGSELLKIALPLLGLLNAKELDKLSCDLKIELLNHLLAHLNEIEADKSYFHEQIVCWKNSGLNLQTELNQFNATLCAQRDEQIRKKNEPSYAISCVSTLANVSTKLGIDYLVPHEVVKCAAVTLGSFLLGSTSGVGFAAYLVSLVGAGVISNAGVYFYGCLLDKIGCTVGDQVKIMIDRLTQSKEGHALVRAELSSKAEKALVKLVNTLLMLPTDGLSENEKTLAEKEKTCIRKIFGLELHEKLKPLLRQQSLPQVGLLFKENQAVEIL
ncbi:MAG: hypothetical protein JO149_01685, partial [Gammaproteobacteria bacterium]|nr:hypothetical protein [Gammaproteobacteria bacterium]